VRKIRAHVHRQKRQILRLVGFWRGKKRPQIKNEIKDALFY